MFYTWVWNILRMFYTWDSMHKEISVTSKMFYFLVPPVNANFSRLRILWRYWKHYDSDYEPHIIIYHSTGNSTLSSISVKKNFPPTRFWDIWVKEKLRGRISKILTYLNRKLNFISKYVHMLITVSQFFLQIFALSTAEYLITPKV